MVSGALAAIKMALSSNQPWKSSMNFIHEHHPSTIHQLSMKYPSTVHQLVASYMAMDLFSIHTIFRGMNIHKSQLFWGELQGYYWFWPIPSRRSRKALSRFVASLQSSFGSLELAAKALGTGAHGGTVDPKKMELNDNTQELKVI